MNITLYYIPGINETDTPVFDTLAHQLLFFSECERYVIDTGFYPPYFKNTITLDINDYDITSPSNYCSLNFNNKEYYYFIVAKRYINETVVEIDIVMDTIQTFMFDVEFIHAFIDRLSINRYGYLGAFNRDYIRENLSQNSFSTISNYETLNTGNTATGVGDWVYVMKMTEDLNADPDNPTTNFTKHLNYLGNSDNPRVSGVTPYQYAFSPFKDMRYDNDSTHTLYSYGIAQFASTKNIVTDIYLIPFRCLKDMHCTSYDSSTETGVLEILGGTDGLMTHELDSDNPLLSKVVIQETTLLNTYVNTETKNLGFKSLYDNAPYGENIPLFSSNNIPQMLDENYIKITFGDGSVRTEYPLHVLTSPLIYLCYWADIASGTRYYNICKGAHSNYMDNEYNTIVVNHDVMHLDLKNDPWKTYLANNRATMIGALLGSGINILGSVAAMGTGVDMETDVTYATGYGGVVKSVAGAYNTLLGRIVNRENLKHAPDSVRRAGAAMADLLGDEYKISYTVTRCDDFEEVAKFYESYGYKVSMSTTNNLFSLNYRHFFDYVKTKELSIHIGDRSTEQNFIDRFNKGLRMWHTTNGVLNIKDTTVDWEMGQVCVYENLEPILLGGE